MIVSENSATRLARGFRAFPPLVLRCSSGRSPGGAGLKPSSKIEAAYYKADHAIQQVLDLLAA